MQRICLPSVMLAALSVVLPAQGLADIVVIGNAKSAISSLTEDKIKGIFLGELSSVDGHAVAPLDQVESAAAYAKFYESYLGMDAKQIKKYWTKMSFTGKATPPKQVASDGEVVQQVSQNVNLVSYVDSAAVTADVKILFKK